MRIAFLSPIRPRALALFLLLLGVIPQANAQDAVRVEGFFKRYHRISLSVTCPETACGRVTSTSSPNPFTDYRLLVTFTAPSGETMTVPGFYAGDGQAAYTEATSGNVWMAHFTPHETGEWTYRVSFQTGPDRVLDRAPGSPLDPDGATGSFTVGETDKTGDDFRAKGFLRHIGAHFFYFSGSNTPFLKNGAGSPENLLHYHEIHNPYQQDTQPVIPPHQFAPHLQDYNEGDPLWGPDRSRGKGVMGALNYLKTLEVNSYYFIVQNTALDGNGQDTAVWPWLTPDVESRDRFSVAKLAQWEVVFSHMDSLGISMNMVTQDRINQWDLDGGELGRIRKLFYRELVARFGHHLGVVWNLGEENSATTAQIKDYANFISDWDAYDHPIVSQANGTLDAHDRYYTPLLGFENFDGPSMQVGLTDLDSLTIPQSPPGRIHNAMLKWVTASREAGFPWVVNLDEIGHWSDGVVPDGDPRDPTNRRVRREAFWGTLMAGGAGVDWYFGSDPFEYNDLWMEDFRVREQFFRRTGDAVRMIRNSQLPYWEMQNLNVISSVPTVWVYGTPGEAYFVYSPYLEPFTLNLPAGEYDIRWYDAFSGGPLQEGTLTEIAIPSDSAQVSIGSPYDFAQDAVAVVTKKPIILGDESEAPRPNRRAILHPAYPNPAYSSATLSFELLEPGRVTLTVYDVLGRPVQALENAFLAPGSYRYEIDTANLASGLYLYRLELDGTAYVMETLPVVRR